MEEDSAGSGNAGSSNTAGSGLVAGSSPNAGSSGDAGSADDAAGSAGSGGTSAGGSTSGAAGQGVSGATNGGTSTGGNGLVGGGSSNGGTANGGASGGGAGGSLAGGGSSSGGAAGSLAGGGAAGSTGGASSCGNGTVDAGEVCDSKLSVNDCGADCKTITPAACFACENDDATCKEFINCDSVTGSAPAGSPAAGVARKYLCNEVLDCMRDTKCSGPEDSPIAKCYCGTANQTDCQSGLGNGPCKAQWERGLETTVFQTLVTRIGNKTYGGGMALSRFDCDQSFCPAACF